VLDLWTNSLTILSFKDTLEITGFNVDDLRQRVLSQHTTNSDHMDLEKPNIMGISTDAN
jgi:hypothetical protein